MKKILSTLTAAIWIINFTLAQSADICSHVEILASDSMAGRKPGTKGIDLAANYIKKYFSENNLSLQFDNGLQTFDMNAGIALGNQNSFACDGRIFMPAIDYIPISYCNDTSLIAPVVFAGYGFSIYTDELKWDDYGNLDVKNKWVIVLRGNPGKKGNKDFDKNTSDRSKMLIAKDKGAAGIILVSGSKLEKNDELLPLPSETGKTKSAFVAVNITRFAANQILSNTGKTIEELEKLLIKHNQPSSFIIGKTLDINMNFVQMKVKTSNVAAMVMSQKKTDKYIIIGAHYDHLGMGGYGSGSRKPDVYEVHNGADDNASGVAAILDLAGRFAKLNLNLNYNLLFVAFTGEEEGLLGSSYFVRHSPIDLKNIKLMLNFDMVGRLNPNKNLSVGGVGTFDDAVKILNNNNDTNLLKLSFNKEGYGPSDHASFYGDSIPVLYFNTGVHGDYHMPQDDFDTINCHGLKKISEFAQKVIIDIAQNNYDLAYKEAGPKTKGGDRTGLKVTLGIMPDFANQDIKGVMAAAVTPDGPAYRGGMQKGDIIVSLNGKPVSDIYDYMERLKNFSSGQTISVDVIRNKKNVILLIKL